MIFAEVQTTTLTSLLWSHSSSSKKSIRANIYLLKAWIEYLQLAAILF